MPLIPLFLQQRVFSVAAQKRGASAWVIVPLMPGVFPDSAKDAAWRKTVGWAYPIGGPFIVTKFTTDSGNLGRVLAQMEVQLETIDENKTLHLVEIERLSIGGYRGIIVYDT